MNDFDINNDLLREYFFKLIPDISLFDYIEWNYYKNNLSGFKTNGIWFFTESFNKDSISEIPFLRCVIKIYNGSITSEELSNIKASNIVFSFTKEDDLYLVLIRNSIDQDSALRNFLDGKKCAGLEF